MKIRTALLVVLALAAVNAAGATNNPPAPASDGSKSASATPPPTQEIRKLSRRERKERMQALSDKYRQFLTDVEPIMQPTELDTFLVLETDAQRDIYIEEFWRRRDVAQGTTNHAYRDLYYNRLEDAKEKFKYVSSDRSRMYLIHGEPASIIDSNCTQLLQPLEIWQYPYVAGLGHDQSILFYMPRNGNDYRIFNPNGMGDLALAELVSQEVMGSSLTPEQAVQTVFYQSESPYSRVSRIETRCKDGDIILRAIFQMQQNQTDIPKIFDPPVVNEEDVHKILRSVVLATPGAAKLPAELSVAYPARQGSRTAAEFTILVPRDKVSPKDVGGTKTYSINVTGEVLKDNALFENYQYRFDFPGDTTAEKLPVIVDRLLRPADYKVRFKVTDATTGAEAILEKDVTVPEIFDTPTQQKQKAAATATVDQLKDDLDSGATRLRIVPLPDDLLSGLQHIETIATGEGIHAVEFYLDGKKVMVKRQPPYTLDLDFGNVPQLHRVRAVATDAKGNVITGDELMVNTGTDPFRVRIVYPRVALQVKGRTRVEMEVRVPEGKKLDHVELYLNETRMATLYGPPFVQTIDIPEKAGVGYIRAVAVLQDDPAPVEDLVMINTPQYMEEVNVHLVELPTTVLSGGKVVPDLKEDAFKVYDEGKPVKLTKFEYVKDLPLSIGLAIDTSGSMQPRMAEAQKAASQFFKNVLRQGDRAFVVSFDSQPQIIQKWSPRLADLNAGLSKLRAEESTALYDAVVYSLYNFLGVKGQRALVVITDGKDTASKFTYDQALEYAKRAAVPIYGIGIGINSTEVDVRYKFGKFCGETGGAVYYIESAEDLHKIYSDIEKELRSQYVLGFYPPQDVKPGSKWRDVSVEVAGGKAKTIRGYYP